MILTQTHQGVSMPSVTAPSWDLHLKLPWATTGDRCTWYQWQCAELRPGASAIRDPWCGDLAARDLAMPV